MADAGFGGVFSGEFVNFFSHVLLSSKLGENTWEKEKGQISQEITWSFQHLTLHSEHQQSQEFFPC